MDFVFRRTYRGPVRGVIFDWAGTTIDYGCRAPAGVFMEVFRRNGVDITIEQAREPMGTHKRVHIEMISKMPDVARRWQNVHGRPCSGQDIDQMFADFIPMQMRCLADYADLIPGCVETMRELRHRQIKIGSTTGYNRPMMELLLQEAKQRGYEPDALVCATEVPAARPEPWMCFENAKILRVYPMSSLVKVDDTIAGIEEGLNASMWTVGVAKTGNELGLSEAEIDALPQNAYESRIQRAYQRMYQAGAHYVIDGLWDLPRILDDIQIQLAQGEQP